MFVDGDFDFDDIFSMHEALDLKTYDEAYSAFKSEERQKAQQQKGRNR